MVLDRCSAEWGLGLPPGDTVTLPQPPPGCNRNASFDGSPFFAQPPTSNTRAPPTALVAPSVWTLSQASHKAGSAPSLQMETQRPRPTVVFPPPPSESSFQLSLLSQQHCFLFRL